MPFEIKCKECGVVSDTEEINFDVDVFVDKYDERKTIANVLLRCPCGFYEEVSGTSEDVPVVGYDKDGNEIVRDLPYDTALWKQLINPEVKIGTRRTIPESWPLPEGWKAIRDAWGDKKIIEKRA
jgi:hypothetical protein